MNDYELTPGEQLAEALLALGPPTPRPQPIQFNLLEYCFAVAGDGWGPRPEA